MTRSLGRAASAALLGSLAGAVCVAAAFATHPGLTLEMDRNLPPIATGFYPAERHETDTFVWTSGRADLTLRGMDRRSPWRCSVRLRSGRPPSIPPPMVSVAVDGLTLAARTAPDVYEEVNVTVPRRRSHAGLTLTIATFPTFVPGPADRRELGVLVDRLACSPATSGLALPPRAAMVLAGVAGAAFGLALSLVGLAGRALIATMLLLAAWQAVPLSIGTAPYSDYPERAVWLAIWIAGSMLAGARVIQAILRRPLHPEARFVIVFSAAALYVKLLALVHPSKLVVDALFHAHRLQWVLAGRLYFTQPMPDGVEFPYAIALYLVAAPWSLLTGDHVAMLRIVVSVSEALAGGLLYLMVVRTWGNRLAGALAVVLFHLVPLPYAVVGNANMTNAFGQSAALAVMAAATVWPLRARNYGQFAGLVLLSSVAFLSHVSTFGILFVTLLAIAGFYRWLGGPNLAGPARLIALAAMIAALVSVVSYYGHFGAVYGKLGRVRAEAGTAATADAPDAAQSDSTAARPSSTVSAMPLRRRAATALAVTLGDIGWPIILLGLVGAWRIWTDRGRDRLACVAAACGLAYLTFTTFATILPVGVRFERYAAEFIGRVDYAVYPAAVVLAARGAVWAWSAGWVLRLAAVGVVAFAFIGGVQHWTGWLE